MPNEIVALKTVNNLPGAEDVTFTIAATDTTLALSGEPADAKAAGDALATKADSNGSYEGLTAGSAEQLLATTGAEDRAPYTLRQTGGGVTVGDRAEEKIVGGTIAWNQVIDLNEIYKSTAGTVSKTGVSIEGTTVTVVHGTTNAWRGERFSNTLAVDHVYLFVMADSATSISGSTIVGSLCADNTATTKYKTGIIGPTAAMFKAVTSDLFIIGWPNATADYTHTIVSPQLFDITQMFGSTVANAVYDLEQATAGAGVAWFRAMFPESYYPYNAGELMSVQTSGKRVDGFNRWDEEWELGTIANSTGGPVSATDRIRSKRFFAVSPSTNYYCTHAAWVYFYDKSKRFLSLDGDARQFTTPAAARFAKIALPATYGTTYKHDICVNISDPAKNGTYKPYTVREYSLDSSLILRGVPKWDSVKGTMYYDGDEYTSDGRVKWRYGIVDMGTLNWNIYGSGETAFFNAYIAAKQGQGVCPRYAYGSVGVSNTMNKVFALLDNLIRVRDTDYTDAAAFKASVSGVYLVYEMATTATDSADPYTGTQWVEAGGTEAFIDAGTETGRVPVPVGHDTFYPTDLRGGLETLLETDLAHADAIAPVQGSTASANIATGELLMQGGKLYKATQAIVAGAEISATNTTLTTIATQLAALEARIAALEN